MKRKIRATFWRLLYVALSVALTVNAHFFAATPNSRIQTSRDLDFAILRVREVKVPKIYAKIKSREELPRGPSKITIPVRIFSDFSDFSRTFFSPNLNQGTSPGDWSCIFYLLGNGTRFCIKFLKILYDCTIVFNGLQKIYFYAHSYLQGVQKKKKNSKFETEDKSNGNPLLHHFFFFFSHYNFPMKTQKHSLLYILYALLVFVE